MTKLLHIYILLFSSLIAFAQNETSKWYFGNHGALDFMTSPPTTLTNAIIDTYEGSSSIADGSGNLLFYTDGVTVWNKLHLTMSNGAGLGGNGSSTQAALIIKQPGGTNDYYIFTTSATGSTIGLAYSKVDMSLAAGMGSVTIKNNILHSQTCEKITAVKHCNGQNVWVITHDYNSNNFRAYLITPSGINLTPVISSIGLVFDYWNSFTGQIKASPNGRKLGCIVPNVCTLYDFNNSNGLVTNPVVLGFINNAYGCEFSPDGTRFYSAGFNGQSLSQWNLCAGSATAIAASETIISPTGSMGSMQLASDGKIYIATGGSVLAIINNPDNLGLACNFSVSGPTLTPSTNNSYGLPNFITSYFKKTIPFTYTNTICKTGNFFSPVSNYAATGNTISSVKWDFGEPLSGASNISTMSTPSHSYTNPGTYSVQLILNYPCGADTIVQLVTIIPCTGILDSEKETISLQIYPSPTAFELNIQLKSQLKNNKATISMYNTAGKLLKSEKITFENNLITINVSDLEDGVYRLILNDDYYFASKSFIKLK